MKDKTLLIISETGADKNITKIKLFSTKDAPLVEQVSSFDLIVF